MSETVGNALPHAALQYLQGGRTVVVATVDPDGKPWTGVMGWVYAPDAKTVRLILARDGQTLANIRANGQIMLEILGDGFIYGVRGRGCVVRESIDGAPVPASVVEMVVDMVKNDLPPGIEFHARIESRWIDPEKQAVEDRGLEMLRALPAPETSGH